MKTSLRRIKTKSGLEHVGLLYEPERKSKIAVAHVHGMGGNFYENQFLDYLAETLTKNGIAFAPFNNSGVGHIQWLNKKGKNVKRGDAFEKFKDCIEDIDAQISFLKKKGFKKIYLAGHSLGAPKVVHYLSKTKDRRVKGLILLAPADMHGLTKQNKKDYRRDLTEAKRLVKAGRGNELLSNYLDDFYPISAHSYLSLNVKPNSGVLSFHDPDYKFRQLNSISVPILTVFGKKDFAQVVKPEKVVEIISANTKKSPRVDTKVLGNAPHSFAGYEPKMAKEISVWIKQNK